MDEAEGVDLPCFLKAPHAPGLDERDVAKETVEGDDFHECYACYDRVICGKSETFGNLGPDESTEDAG